MNKNLYKSCSFSLYIKIYDTTYLLPTDVNMMGDSHISPIQLCDQKCQKKGNLNYIFIQTGVLRVFEPKSYCILIIIELVQILFNSQKNLDALRNQPSVGELPTNLSFYIYRIYPVVLKLLYI